VRRAIQTLGQVEEVRGITPAVSGRGDMAGVALYASLFESRIAGLELFNLPAGHREGPIFLNILRYLDTPQAVALAAERTSIKLSGHDASAWQFPVAVGKSLGWDKGRLRITAVETPHLE
jgi:hypothetical protein